MVYSHKRSDFSITYPVFVYNNLENPTFVGKSTVFIISHNTSASCRRECFASWGDGHFPKANTVWRVGEEGGSDQIFAIFGNVSFSNSYPLNSRLSSKQQIVPNVSMLGNMYVEIAPPPKKKL